MTKPVNPPDVIFDPDDVSRRTVSSIERISQQQDLSLIAGISSIDAVLKPLMPNRMTGILGYTSNGKSTLANAIARHNARELITINANQAVTKPPRAVVTFTWEQTVEEQGLDDIAHIIKLPVGLLYTGNLTAEQWIVFKDGAMRRSLLPWWVIGHSSEDNKRRPRMNMDDVALVMGWLVDKMNINPTLVVLDYLQRINRDKELSQATMRESFIEIVDRAKDMTHSFHCHTILVSQAKREVNNGKWCLPQLEDSQETSNFEQTCDAILSTWLPKNTFPLTADGNDPLKVNGIDFDVDENLMIVGIIKQKKGICPVTIPLHVDWDTYTISAIQTTNLDIATGKMPHGRIGRR
jgi:replicative DNA helicase